MTAASTKAGPSPLRTAWRDSPRLTTLVSAALILTLASMSVSTIWYARAYLRDSELFGDWQASQYWLTYRFGFVRRALPGEVLSWFTEGPPGAVTVQVAGLLVSGGGLVAILVLVTRLARSVESPSDRFLLVGVLLTSPLTVSLVVRDLGRYDAIGFIAFAVLARLSWRRGTAPWASAAVAAVVVAAAVASSEFLFPLMVPIVLVALWQRRLPWRSWTYATVVTVSLGPGLAIMLASIFVRPADGLVPATLTDAAAAGAAIKPVNGVSVIGEGFNFAHMEGLHPATFVICAVVLGGFYFVSSWIVWRICGACHKPIARQLMGIYALAAVGLSVIGIDYRRWWALAFVAFIACVPRLCRAPLERSTPLTQELRHSRVAWALLAGLLIASVPAQRAPVYPTWDDRAIEATGSPTTIHEAD